MPTSDRELLLRLAAASRNLVTVVENAVTNDVIQPGYETMLSGPAETVAEILAVTPGGTMGWDGTFHLADVVEQIISTPGDDVYQSSPSGIELTHRPTGITRQSISKGDVDKNRAVALDSLEKAVLRRASTG